MFNKGSGIVYNISDPDSTSLSDGNLVDGLPSVRHTEAVGGSHGVFGPAPICNIGPRKTRFEEKCYRKSSGRFVQVLVCIVMLLLG